MGVPAASLCFLTNVSTKDVTVRIEVLNTNGAVVGDSGEITATESAFYLAWYLVTNYGKDSAVTRLLDRKAIYIEGEPGVTRTITYSQLTR